MISIASGFSPIYLLINRLLFGLGEKHPFLLVILGINDFD